MNSWASKFKRVIPVILSFLVLLSMAACSSKEQESGQSGEDNGSSQESSGQSETVIDTVTPVQYVYSSDTVTFAEYGDRVDVCDVAGREDQVYVLMEVKNWDEGAADDEPSEVFYQVMSCLPDGSQRSVSDKITLQAEAGNITEIHISDAGGVAALCQTDVGSMKLLFRDVFRDIYWEKETGASEGRLFLQGKDMIVFCVNNGRYTMVSYDESGEPGESINLDAAVFEEAQAVYLQPDGCFLAVKTNMEGETYAQVYDPVSGLAERKSLPDNFSRYQVFQGNTTDVLLCDTVGVYGYDAGSDAPVPAVTYIDAGLGIERFRLVRQIDETHFAGIYYEGMDSVLGLFSRKEAPEDLQVIVMGVFKESDIPKDRILDFNRENNGYRITVKQYVSYSDELDAYTQLNMDILAGNMPDILAMDSSVQLQSLISKGLLADVDELISQDGELSDVEFMENVFDALRVDGVLYQIVPGFAVDTLIAKQSIAGDRTGWTAEEFSQVLATLPEGMEAVSEMSRYDYMADYMDACAGGLIDYDLGGCHFDSPEFKAALEFAATIPETAEAYGDGEYTIDPTGHMYDSRYIEDKVLLQPVSITRVRDLCPMINGALGEDGVYVGFPSDSREGGVLRIFGTSFVLSSQSSRLDGAWSFARYLLTEDYQGGLLDRGGGLPTRKDVFEDNVQDAAGFEGFCFINDEYTKLPALTPEQLDRAVEFIEGVHHFTFDDVTVMNIIYEEAEGYFHGQKDVESVVDVIQNRVGMYLQEQME